MTEIIGRWVFVEKTLTDRQKKRVIKKLRKKVLEIEGAENHRNWEVVYKEKHELDDRHYVSDTIGVKCDVDFREDDAWRKECAGNEGDLMYGQLESI